MTTFSNLSICPAAKAVCENKTIKIKNGFSQNNENTIILLDSEKYPSIGNTLENIVRVLDSLLDNREEYVYDIYLDWEAEIFVKYFLHCYV